MTTRYKHSPDRRSLRCLVCDVRTYPPDTLLRLQPVCDTVGLKKSALYKSIAEGSFPAPKKIGARAVAWSANEVFQWLAERPSAR